MEADQTKNVTNGLLLAGNTKQLPTALETEELTLRYIDLFSPPISSSVTVHYWFDNAVNVDLWVLRRSAVARRASCVYATLTAESTAMKAYLCLSLALAVLLLPNMSQARVLRATSNAGALSRRTGLSRRTRVSSRPMHVQSACLGYKLPC